MASKPATGFRRRFEFGLGWRTLALIGAIWLLAEAIRTPDLAAARLVAALIALAALASLWEFIRRTNFQVSRFIESVRFEDYAQRFSDPSGGGFDVLGDTLDAALKALQQRHITAAPRAYPGSSKAIANSPRLPTSSASCSRPGSGQTKSCDWRWPGLATGRSMRSPRSARTR
jgi:hypothetical protein